MLCLSKLLVSRIFRGSSDKKWVKGCEGRVDKWKFWAVIGRKYVRRGQGGKSLETLLR